MRFIKSYGKISGINANYFFDEKPNWSEKKVDLGLESKSDYELTFEVLDRLSKSVSEGAYLTNSIYLRKELWCQGNATINFIEEKLTAYKEVSKAIDALSITYKQEVVNAQNYSTLFSRLEGIKNKLYGEFEEEKKESQGLYQSIIKNVSSTLKNGLYKKKIKDFREFLPTLEKTLKNVKFLSKPLTRKNVR